MNTATKSALLTAVEKTAFRASLLMRAATHPERRAIGTWSEAETANHMAHCYPSFIDAFEGTFSVAAEDVDAHNAEVLAADLGQRCRIQPHRGRSQCQTDRPTSTQ